jgi:PQQ-dependent catabolism-associated CXXCW motif protein
VIARAGCAALAVLVLAAQVAPAEPVAEPDGYRMGEYRAPVPATLAGAVVLDTDGARAMWQAGGAVFVDVLPSPPKPDGLRPGTIWQAPSRDTIPGATWLPNTGFGVLAPETDAYFRANLDRLTGGDPARPVVFFCLADCWMSWNAARRAVVEYGLDAVHWYPLGTDGWQASGLPLEKVRAAE